MKIDHLRYFMAVVDHGSAAQAAKAVGKNHTNLLTRLAQLEKDLDVKLFDRSQGQPLILTSAGEALIRPARNILREVDAAHKALHKYRVNTATE